MACSGFEDSVKIRTFAARIDSLYCHLPDFDLIVLYKLVEKLCRISKLQQGNVRIRINQSGY